MKKYFIFTALFSVFSQAQIDLERRAAPRQFLEILYQGLGFSSISAFVPLAITTEIGQKISEELRKAEAIEQEAQKQIQSIYALIKKPESVDETYRERREKIRVLKKQIANKGTTWNLNSDQELEDLQFELFELLENPLAFELHKTGKSSDLADESIDLRRPIFDLAKRQSVPHMRMAAPKKTGQGGTSSNSQSSPQQTPAPDVQPPTALSAPGMMPVTAMPQIPMVLINVQTPMGPYPYPIPLEVHQAIVALTNENRGLKEESARLREELEVIYKRDVERLQTEVTRLEADNERMHCEVTRLTEDNVVLHFENKEVKAEINRLIAENKNLYRENQQLREELSVIKQELRETKQELRETREELITLQSRFDENQCFIQLAEVLNYVNVAVRRAFGYGPTGYGYAAIWKKAKKNQLDEEEMRIWRQFVMEHPGADNEQLVNLVRFVTEGRIQRAHPSVTRLSQEDLRQRLKTITKENDDLISRAVLFIWTFPVE